MNLDGYIRVSRVRGREGPSFISPDVQRERCEAFARAGGHTVVHWIEDLDEPGSKIDRPGLQSAIERIENGQSDGVVVARLDRFARSAADAANLVRRITEANGALLCAQESIDTAGSFGRFVVSIMAAIGELELDRITDNWRTAREKAVTRGVHLASVVPFGYDRGNDGVLVPNQHSDLVRRVFEKRIGGDSWKTLAGFIMRDTPDVQWSPVRVRKMVGNRVYLGEARSGDLVNPQAHEPIVSHDLWIQANRTRSVAHPRNGKTRGLLAGTLRCAGCSYAMKIASGKSRHGKPFREYRCPKTTAAGTCPSPTSTKADRVERYVVNRFLKGMADAKIKVEQTTSETSEAEKNVADAERELAASLDGKLADVLGDDPVLLEAIAKRRQVVEDARDELDRLRAKNPVVLPEGESFDDFWDGLDFDDRRKLIAAGFDAIFIRRPLKGYSHGFAQRLSFVDRGVGVGFDLPRRGVKGVIRPFDPPDGIWEPPTDDFGNDGVDGLT